ncbi:MAG: c-type cytochrome, partial [Nitrospirales bacterium]
ANRSFAAGAVRKFVVALILGVIVWFGSGALGFPLVFQKMFVLYVGLGLFIFLLLEAPSLPRASGFPFWIALAGFYLLLSVAYILGARALPQNDPQDEKAEIVKLLEAQKENALREQHNLEDLFTQVEALQKKADMLGIRLKKVARTQRQASPLPDGSHPQTARLTLVERGIEVYDFYECYNCHKIRGEGGRKKRGPVLDNIGNLLTREDIKKKIFDPGYLYAEGFEKQHKKGEMPEDYRDLMMDEEVEALAVYLSTLKNPEVDTPKPIFVKATVEHGFTVYGFVRDAKGQPVADVEVTARPMKEHGRGKSVKTDQAGYYEVFLHMHNEDAGKEIQVSAAGAQKEIVADYDPKDKVTKRQASVDLTVPAG